MQQYKELQKKYWSIFSPIDQIRSSYHLDFSQKIVLTEIAKQLSTILELYNEIIDNNELKLIEEKLSFYIGALGLDSHSQDILTLYYFNEDKNYNYSLLTNLFQVFNIQFKFFKDKLRLQSTYWQYFQRDISGLYSSLQREFSKKDNPRMGNLYFLLLSSIEAINSSLKAGDRDFQKSMYLIFESLKGLLNFRIKSDNKFKELMEKSPGFLIYLQYLTKLIPGLIEDKVFVKNLNKQLEKLNLSLISPKSISFYILNQIELEKKVDNIIDIYEKNKNEIKSTYPYFDFFIETHIKLQKGDITSIGIDINFDDLNEEKVEKIIENLKENDELKSEKSNLEEIGNIIDWSSRLQNLYEWYQNIPIEVKTIIYTSILRIIF